MMLQEEWSFWALPERRLTRLRSYPLTPALSPSEGEREIRGPGKRELRASFSPFEGARAGVRGRQRCPVAPVVHIALFFLVACGSGEVSNIKNNQEIVFFPTIGHRAADGKGWELEVHGCVYEEEKRWLALGLLRKGLQLEHVNMTAAENAIFTTRTRLFMVDHERGKKIIVNAGGHVFKSSKSRPDGQFWCNVRLSDKELQDLPGATLQVRAVLRNGDQRVFTGDVSLFGKAGVTVISDIDDTIKITQVRDRRAALRNTFLEPFAPVPGMAKVYSGWQQRGAQFCYVSASPWQIFLPLTEFVRSNGFPPGAFYLKDFRWKDESFFNLFESPEKYKPKIIEPLLERFPNRQFVLVGDSGERDPEIYGALARKFPSQIARIFIREVTGQSEPERYQNAFRDLPPGLWKIFRDPAEIADAFP